MNNGAGLFSLGKGKFYREDGELTLDVGPFAAALEFASGAEAVVVGKPDQAFFKAAVEDMGIGLHEVVMVRTCF
jgi:phospholysine phosphohistidine inorganic pyrophosphate phosphatase